MPPFKTTEEAIAWFTAQALPYHGTAEVIFLAITQLYMNRLLKQDHILVLRHYGRRGQAPRDTHDKEKKAYSIWRDAISIVEPALIRQGIVSAPAYAASGNGAALPVGG